MRPTSAGKVKQIPNMEVGGWVQVSLEKNVLENRPKIALYTSNDILE